MATPLVLPTHPTSPDPAMHRAPPHSNSASNWALWTRCIGLGSGAPPLGIYPSPGRINLFFWYDEPISPRHFPARQTCSQPNQPDCILPAQAGLKFSVLFFCLFARGPPRVVTVLPLSPSLLDTRYGSALAAVDPCSSTIRFEVYT